MSLVINKSCIIHVILICPNNHFVRYVQDFVRQDQPLLLLALCFAHDNKILLGLVLVPFVSIREYIDDVIFAVYAEINTTLNKRSKNVEINKLLFADFEHGR